MPRRSVAIERPTAQHEVAHGLSCSVFWAAMKAASSTGSQLSLGGRSGVYARGTIRAGRRGLGAARASGEEHGCVVALLLLIVELDALHGFFTTTDLTFGQWLTCLAVGSAILWVGELVKALLRARDRRQSAHHPQATA